MAWSIGRPVPYSGVLTAGVFVVCTSKFSDGGAHVYAIAGDPTALKLVTSVSMEPGECRVVAEAKNNPRKADQWSVTVTPLITGFANAVVIIDSDCSANCLVTATTPSFVLEGSAGAVAKFYVGRNVENAGGHGGTGTLNFELD